MNISFGAVVGLARVTLLVQDNDLPMKIPRRIASNNGYQRKTE